MTSPAWIETFSGRRFDVLDPQPEQFTIEDIAHALSMLCRWTGQCEFFYSVGQHCYLGSYLVPKECALWFLLHDASEAFIGDMHSPMKHHTDAGKSYSIVEESIMRTICRKFDLSLPEPEVIKQIDMAMLAAERKALMKPLEWDKSRDSVVAANVQISEMHPREVEVLFLNRFYQLKRW